MWYPHNSIGAHSLDLLVFKNANQPPSLPLHRLCSQHPHDTEETCRPWQPTNNKSLHHLRAEPIHSSTLPLQCPNYLSAIWQGTAPLNTLAMPRPQTVCESGLGAPKSVSSPSMFTASSVKVSSSPFLLRTSGLRNSGIKYTSELSYIWTWCILWTICDCTEIKQQSTSQVQVG